MNTINPVQVMLEQLKNEFLAELPARTEEIEQLILGLNANDNYEEIYRQVHSLKGTGGTHGIPIISIICHELENFIEKEHSLGELNSDQSIDHCLLFIDLLIQTQKETIKTSPHYNDIQQALNKITNKISPNKHNVLIIESSKLYIDLIKESLSSLPLTIEVSTNGLKALELVLNKRYDIIITGKEIDELNGEAIIAAFKLSKPASKSTKCILLTSKPATKTRLKRTTDPDSILKRSTSLSSNINTCVKELLKIAI
ncbi:MAG: Hpt domain-containing protein [Gammaproteobacteria bacterium]|nr:Hpt domain-containing protein [Gammaproteobacteria bacterium]